MITETSVTIRDAEGCRDCADVTGRGVTKPDDVNNLSSVNIAAGELECVGLIRKQQRHPLNETAHTACIQLNLVRQQYQLCISSTAGKVLLMVACVCYDVCVTIVLRENGYRTKLSK